MFILQNDILFFSLDLSEKELILVLLKYLKTQVFKAQIS